MKALQQKKNPAQTVKPVCLRSLTVSELRVRVSSTIQASRARLAHARCASAHQSSTIVTSTLSRRRSQAAGMARATPLTSDHRYPAAGRAAGSAVWCSEAVPRASAAPSEPDFPWLVPSWPGHWHTRTPVTRSVMQRRGAPGPRATSGHHAAPCEES